METHQGKSLPVVEEYQIEGTWAPITPIKPLVSRPRPIYEDGQVGGGLMSQVFAKESEDYLSRFSQQNQAQNLLSSSNIHQNYGNVNNIWGVDNRMNSQREDFLHDLGGQSRRTMPSFGLPNNSYPSFSSWDVPLTWGNNGSLLEQNSTYSNTQFESMSFGDLLAMNGSTLEASMISERVGDVGGAATNSVFPGWNSQLENTRLDGNSMFRSQDGYREINQQFNGIFGHEIRNSACSHQSWSLSNVNSSPRAMNISGENSTFAPPTPDSQWKADTTVPLRDTNLATQRKPNERNEVPAAMVNLEGLNNKEVTGATTDSSSGKVSVVMDENHNPDKGDNQGIDLNKTPLKKPRRRRYTPKVVKENKPKRTPKPKTPKPTEGKEAPKPADGKEATKPTEGKEAPKTTEGKEAPKTKRKYVRKKKTGIPSKSSVGETETIDSNPKTSGSCKKSLNFDLEKSNSAVDAESQPSDFHPVNRRQEENLVMKTSQVEFGYDLNHAVNQELKSYINLPQQVTKETEKVTGNLMENNAPESSRTDPAQSRHSSPCASSNEGVQSRGSKRVISSIADAGNFVDAGNLGTDHGTYCPPNPIFLQNLNAHKKMRTASQDQEDDTQNHSRVDTTASKYYQCGPAPYGTNALTSDQLEMLRRCAGNRIQLLNTWAGMARMKMKNQSQEIVPVSPAKSTPRRRKSDISNTPFTGNSVHSCTEALTGDTNETLKPKRRNRRKSSVTDPISRAQKAWAVVLYNGNQSGRNKSGSRGKTISVEAITEGLKQLDINREQNALVPYHGNNQEKNALVLYKNDGTLVPFEGPFNPVRKRRQRAKVDLDDETSRVWQLLLENIENQGINGTDEEKVKWWENERSVFHGRVDSFIARMRLVQGDRRFTPWKGSVLDSVIGVFLTQNVSDHLSSSAYMALAARFPIKSESCESTLSEETNAFIVEPEVCMIQTEESITLSEKPMNQPLCDRNSTVIHEIYHIGEKEDANSKERDYFSESSRKATRESRLNIENSHTIEREAASTLRDDTARGDATSSQHSIISSQNSVNSSNLQAEGIIRAFPDSNSRAQALASSSQCNYFDSSTSFLSLLKMAERPLRHDSYSQILGHDPPEYMTHVAKEMIEVESRSSDTFRKDENSTTGSYYVLEGGKMSVHSPTQSRKDSPDNVASSNQGRTSSIWKSPNLPNSSNEAADISESTITFGRTSNSASGGISIMSEANPTKSKRQKAEKDKEKAYEWENLRKQVQGNGGKKERPYNRRDSLDWEAVRHADASVIADTIKERGMNNVLAGRIKDLLDKLVKDHGSTDLEWLRDIPPDKAKEYLLSFRGLGLKSVECVRLLTLHHLAFPVDTNVGRIAVRLGWVPLQPLPESLQLHLLEMYPILESIQKYLWPRLCKLDQKTLYELHYHLITFGKVFCTKRQPNCNACPLRGECRHFASAFASARLALPCPEERSIMALSGGSSVHINPHNNIKPLLLPPSSSNDHQETNFGYNKDAPITEVPSTPLSLSLTQPTQHLERKSQVNCEPIVEVPASPEPEQEPTLCDIEDSFYDDPDEIPTIELNIEKFTQTLQNVMQANRELQESGMSRALVALTAEAASIPTPKLKNISRLRTEHHVYELPDTHPLLKELNRREHDDPCSYLLAIWTPGETADTIQTPDRTCSSDDPSILCNEETCSYCNSQREANSQIVRGTLLIPCRTAMRGSFPLNGTYFQVNEVFADHDSSLDPINVPRSWLWNLPRRTVYFGTSVPTIFKGLTTEEIQHCFWRGFVCVRGFDQKTRSPRPLMARLHFPASKMPRGAKGKADYE